MHLGDPTSVMAAAVYSALLRDLPDIPGHTQMLLGSEREVPARRPNMGDIEVCMFVETWGSTALGYDGVGGQAMTSAYTVVVMDEIGSVACVYWGGGGLGFKTENQKEIRQILDRRCTNRRSPGWTKHL